MADAPETKSSAFSSSESLARGLARAMLQQWDECQRAHDARLKAKRSSRHLPKLPGKRGPQYRVLCERTRGLIPCEQFIAEAFHGDPSGMDRRAGYAALHWTPDVNNLAIELIVSYARPGWRLPRRWCLLTISQHALRRLFYRLKTLEASAVFAELTPAMAALIDWYGPIAGLVPRVRSVELPTPNGVLVIVLDEHSENTVAGRPDGLVGATWISDERMTLDAERREALQRAREVGGLVVQVVDGRTVVTKANVSMFEPYLRAWTDVYFDEMVALLPGPKAFRLS